MSDTAIWRQYFALTKPGVVALLMVTAVAGMFLATEPAGMVPLSILLPATAGLSLAMMASAAINQIMDQKIDAMMARTLNRPIVTGRINTRAAIVFAVALALASMLMLYFLVNLNVSLGLTVIGSLKRHH